MRTQKGKILLVALGMCCAMVFGVPVKASGEVSNNYDEEITLQYVNLRNVTASLSISNGTATCNSKLTMQTNKSCSITMTLQKKSGSSWENIKTWSKSGTGDLALKESRSVPKGETYRVKATGTCGSESETRYSSVISYQ